jgi:hypothetical protein
MRSSAKTGLRTNLHQVKRRGAATVPSVSAPVQQFVPEWRVRHANLRLSRQQSGNPPTAAPQLRRQDAFALPGFLQRGFVVRRVNFDGVTDAIAAH